MLCEDLQRAEVVWRALLEFGSSDRSLANSKGTFLTKWAGAPSNHFAFALGALPYTFRAESGRWHLTTFLSLSPAAKARLQALNAALEEIRAARAEQPAAQAAQPSLQTGS